MGASTIKDYIELKRKEITARNGNTPDAAHPFRDANDFHTVLERTAAAYEIDAEDLAQADDYGLSRRQIVILSAVLGLSEKEHADFEQFVRVTGGITFDADNRPIPVLQDVKTKVVEIIARFHAELPQPEILSPPVIQIPDTDVPQTAQNAPNAVDAQTPTDSTSIHAYIRMLMDQHVGPGKRFQDKAMFMAILKKAASHFEQDMDNLSQLGQTPLTHYEMKLLAAMFGLNDADEMNSKIKNKAGSYVQFARLASRQYPETIAARQRKTPTSTGYVNYNDALNYVNQERLEHFVKMLHAGVEGETRNKAVLDFFDMLYERHDFGTRGELLKQIAKQANADDALAGELFSSMAGWTEGAHGNIVPLKEPAARMVAAYAFPENTDMKEKVGCFLAALPYREKLPHAGTKEAAEGREKEKQGRTAEQEAKRQAAEQRKLDKARAAEERQARKAEKEQEKQRKAAAREERHKAAERRRQEQEQKRAQRQRNKENRQIVAERRQAMDYRGGGEETKRDEKRRARAAEAAQAEHERLEARATAAGAIRMTFDYDAIDGDAPPLRHSGKRRQHREHKPLPPKPPLLERAVLDGCFEGGSPHYVNVDAEWEERNQALRRFIDVIAGVHGIGHHNIVRGLSAKIAQQTGIEATAMQSAIGTLYKSSGSRILRQEPEADGDAKPILMFGSIVSREMAEIIARFAFPENTALQEKTIGFLSDEKHLKTTRDRTARMVAAKSSLKAAGDTVETATASFTFPANASGQEMKGQALLDYALSKKVSDPAYHFGCLLEEVWQASGLNKKPFAAAFGMQNAQYEKFVAGNAAAPTLSTLNRFANGLGAQTDEERVEWRKFILGVAPDVNQELLNSCLKHGTEVKTLRDVDIDAQGFGRTIALARFVKLLENAHGLNDHGQLKDIIAVRTGLSEEQKIRLHKTLNNLTGNAANADIDTTKEKPEILANHDKRGKLLHEDLATKVAEFAFPDSVPEAEEKRKQCVEFLSSAEKYHVPHDVVSAQRSTIMKQVRSEKYWSSKVKKGSGAESQLSR